MSLLAFVPASWCQLAAWAESRRALSAVFNAHLANALAEHWQQCETPATPFHHLPAVVCQGRQQARGAGTHHISHAWRIQQNEILCIATCNYLSSTVGCHVFIHFLGKSSPKWLLHQCYVTLCCRRGGRGTGSLRRSDQCHIQLTIGVSLTHTASQKS